MHILLTDILTCPRCGPEFGLILLADRLEGREVVEGSLGCANCREQYPIEDRNVDLRFGKGGSARIAPPAPDASPAELAMRYAALLGVTDGPASILLVDVDPVVIRELSAVVEGVQIVAATTGAPPEEAGSGWLLVGDRLPVRGRSIRGVLFVGAIGEQLILDGARTLTPGSRIVLDQPAAGASELLVGAGLSTLLEQDGVVVAVAG